MGTQPQNHHYSKILTNNMDKKGADVPTTIAILPRKILWPQWIGGIGATLVMIVAGLVGGWSSPNLARLLSDDSPLLITSAEGSWIASLMNIGRFIGGIVAAFSVEYFGSGKTMFLIGFPTALGWISSMFANHVVWLYVARILGGIGVGMTFCAFPIYIGSIADPSIRGTLVSLAINGAAIGNLLGTVMGSYLPMHYYSLVALIPTVSYVVLFAWIHESPHDLIRSGRIEEARKALKWYNRNVELNNELESIKEYIFASSSTSITDRLKEFKLPHNRKAVIIVIILFLFMQLAGMNSLLFYMEIIMVRAKVTSVTPSSIVIMGGIVSIVTGWAAMYLIETSGRRMLLILSSIGIFLSMLTMGLHFTLLEYRPDLPPRDWLSIGSLMVWEIFYYLGVFVVPSTVLSELFPANLKSLAASGASIASGLFAFVSSKSYQPMVDHLGEQYVFWTYGFITILALPFAVFCMPETKGKSLQEIQESLISGKSGTVKDTGSV